MPQGFNDDYKEDDDDDDGNDDDDDDDNDYGGDGDDDDKYNNEDDDNDDDDEMVIMSIKTTLKVHFLNLSSGLVMSIKLKIFMLEYSALSNEKIRQKNR